MGLRIVSVSCICIFALTIAGCSHISGDAKAYLGKPVNCATAEQDIAILKEERASTGKQIASGVKSVVPVAAVGNLLMGQYNDGVKVATGRYNDDIDRKITQIKDTCGIR